MKDIPRIKIKLIGEDGNIFNLLAIARRTLKELLLETDDSRYEDIWNKLHDDVTSSDSYDEALNHFIQVFDIS